jgi:hypothetical protein
VLRSRGSIARAGSTSFRTSCSERLDPATELYVREQLDALADPELTEDQQRERWKRIKERAPGLTAAGGRIIEGLASAAIRQQLGL